MTILPETETIISQSQQFFRSNKIFSKFFPNDKPENIAANNDKIENTALTSNNNNTAGPVDVSIVLQDVHLILEGRSPEEGKILLTGMVADLLKEVDMLRFRLAESEKQFTRVKKERDLVNNDYRDSVLSLMLVLQNFTGEEIDLQEIFKDTKLLTPEEVSQVTVKALTNKSYKLENENIELKETITKCQEEIDDLRCENDAKNIKINALEKQFKSINKKRQKVVAKHADRKPDNTIHPNVPNTISPNTISPEQKRSASNKISPIKMNAMRRRIAAQLADAKE